jgi:hypothetical protein
MVMTRSLDISLQQPVGEANPSVYECPECGRQPLDVFARFEYPYELFDQDFPEFAGRKQDLFSWFSLLGKCRRCAQLLVVANFECA